MKTTRTKWGDFLFTLVVRLIAGAVLGALASLLVCVPVRRASRHSLLVWVTGDADHPHRFAYWILAWAIGGSIIGVFTIPYWQTPWYQYERLKFDKSKEDQKEGGYIPPPQPQRITQIS